MRSRVNPTAQATTIRVVAKRGSPQPRVIDGVGENSVGDDEQGLAQIEPRLRVKRQRTQVGGRLDQAKLYDTHTRSFGDCLLHQGRAHTPFMSRFNGEGADRTSRAVVHRGDKDAANNVPVFLCHITPAAGILQLATNEARCDLQCRQFGRKIVDGGNPGA